MNTKEKKKEKKKYLFIISIIAILSAFSATAALYIYQNLNPKDNKKQSISSIEKISTETDSNDEKIDGASLEYAGYVTVRKDENLITLNFANPTRSNKNLDLEITININGEDITLTKTDIIGPGNKITSAEYTTNRDIPTGSYDGKFIIHFYNDRNQEEIVTTNIDIKVYVK